VRVLRLELEKRTAEVEDYKQRLLHASLDVRPMDNTRVDLIKRVTSAASYKLHSDLHSGDEDDDESTDEGDEGGGGCSAWQEWRFESVLEPRRLHCIVGDALERAILDSPGLPGNLQNGRGFRAILHQLGTMGDDEAVRQILRSTPLNEAMTKAVWEAIIEFTSEYDAIERGKAQLKEREREREREGRPRPQQPTRRSPSSPTGSRRRSRKALLESQIGEPDDEDLSASELHDSEMIESCGTVGTRTLTFGGPDLYYESMMDLVGTPAMDGLVGMRREHTICADSQVKFTAPNCIASELQPPRNDLAIALK